mmetsp:Transcript_111432/g.279030  ORF Transcript_111432/g.279030 Transcript_111432/m.279030 type:complete len:241 (+) Transcript_111432:1988-2710(+)
MAIVPVGGEAVLHMHLRGIWHAESHLVADGKAYLATCRTPPRHLAHPVGLGCTCTLDEPRCSTTADGTVAATSVMSGCIAAFNHVDILDRGSIRWQTSNHAGEFAQLFHAGRLRVALHAQAHTEEHQILFGKARCRWWFFSLFLVRSPRSSNGRCSNSSLCSGCCSSFRLFAIEARRCSFSGGQCCFRLGHVDVAAVVCRRLRTSQKTKTTAVVVGLHNAQVNLGRHFAVVANRGQRRYV